MGKKKMLLAEDPPIIVGGGSSTYIWVKKGLLDTTPVQDPHPEYEIEFDKSKYDCYDVAVDLVSYKTHDGNDGGNRHPVKNRKKHCTRFYDSGSDPG
jgi:hypothetical protein